MFDPRYRTFAEKLVNHSCSLKPGEKLLLEVTGHEDVLAKEIIRAVYKAGGQPFLSLIDESLQKAWLTGGSDGISREALEAQARWDKARMEEMDAYISISIKENTYEMLSVPEAVNTRYAQYYRRPVHLETRQMKTKWTGIRYPNPSMAQAAGMPTEDFEDFYLTVCNFDYARLGEAGLALKERMEKADRVEIKAPGADLSFSIKDIGCVSCEGLRNLPDGEVLTAPVKESVEGWIRYNTTSAYQGRLFRGVELHFSKGRIVEAKADVHNEAVQAILDTDEGARYIGEFAFGVNPAILHPINDTLFDEKITGSIHFTPGNTYRTANNGNHSGVHWDLVYILREDYGGGSILFDGELIQKDGRFMPPALQHLNPENLLKIISG